MAPSVLDILWTILVFLTLSKREVQDNDDDERMKKVRLKDMR